MISSPYPFPGTPPKAEQAASSLLPARQTSLGRKEKTVTGKWLFRNGDGSGENSSCRR